MNSSSHLPRKKKAFALIVAMALMGFVMLLLLSLSTLTTLEVATTSKNRDVTVARQNAYFGMLAALGELQKAAGPDSNVTARADIFVSSQGFPESAVEHPYWLGVWNTDLDPDKNPVEEEEDWDRLSAQQKVERARWIVSGNEGLALDDPDYLTPLVTLPNDGTSVELAKAVSAYNIPAVRARKVEAHNPNSAEGNYAYWVSGDNSKALVSVVDPESGSADVDALNRSFQVAQRTGVEATTGLGNYPINGAKLTRMIDMSSGFSDWMTSGSDDANELKRARFHDLTYWSKGLLTDVKDGALKRDLTQLFEIDASFENVFSDMNTTNATDASDEAADPTTPEPYYLVQDSVIKSGSPNWSVLKDYYQHYWPTPAANDQTDNQIRMKATVTSPEGIAVYKYLPRKGLIATNDIPTSPWADGELPYQVEYDSVTLRGDNYQYKSWMVPVISQFRISHSFRLNTDKPEKTIPEILLKPVVSVYNPYNTKINANDFRYDWRLNPKISLTLHLSTGSEVVSFYQAELYTQDFSGKWSGQFNDPTIIDPGATVHQAYDDLVLQAVSGNRMSMKWEGVGGLRLRLDNYDGEVGGPDGASQDGAISYDEAAESGKKQKAWAAKWGISQNERDLLQQAIQEDAAIEISIEYDDFGGITIYANSYVPDQSFQKIDDLWRFESQGQPESFSQSYQFMTDATDQDSFQTLVFSLKTTERLDPTDTSDAFRNLIDLNMRSIHSNSKWDGSVGYSRYLSLYTAQTLGQNLEAPDSETTDTGVKKGFWGNSIDSEGGQSSVVLFERPREPLLSLGQLQHANLSRYHFDPTYIVGNSYASLRVPMNETSADNFGGETGLKMFDLSYLVNERLWDGFFFSTIEIPRDSVERNALKVSLSGDSKSLSDLTLNPRMEFIDSELTDSERYEQIIDLADENSVKDGYGSYRAASEMWVNGAFNVNSTSVEAWKAILSSTRSLQIPIYNTDGSQENVISEDDTVFSRFSRPYNRSYASSGGDGDEQFWKGYRSLTDYEITDLAEGIVEQVKERGPFFSLASFVNRRLTNDEYGKKGALQAALDDPLLGSSASLAVNQFPGSIASEEVKTFTEATSLLSNNLSSTDRTNMGFPGYVLQADILQHLGPLLTVRSDTFTIRSYGDVVDPLTKKVTGRAWCEAKVQRIPQPMNIPAGATKMDEFIRPSSSFGREFRILAFTWLSEDEV